MTGDSETTCCMGPPLQRAGQQGCLTLHPTTFQILFDLALNRSSQQGKYDPSLRKLTLPLFVRLPVLILVITTHNHLLFKDVLLALKVLFYFQLFPFMLISNYFHTSTQSI